MDGREEARIVGLGITAMYVCLLMAAFAGARQMPLQLVTASFALLFAALLILSSDWFVDTHLANLDPAFPALVR